MKALLGALPTLPPFVRPALKGTAVACAPGLGVSANLGGISEGGIAVCLECEAFGYVGRGCCKTGNDGADLAGGRISVGAAGARRKAGGGGIASVDSEGEASLAAAVAAGLGLKTNCLLSYSADKSS